MEHLPLPELFQGNLDTLEMGTSFHGGLTLKAERELIRRGLMCGKSWNRWFSIQGPHWKFGEGALTTRNIESWIQVCSRDGTSLSEETHCRGPRERAPILGTLGYERKALGLLGCSFGQPAVDLCTGDLQKCLKGFLEVGCFSLWGLCEWNLEIGRKVSGDGHLFPQWPCWGTWKGLICRGFLEMREAVGMEHYPLSRLGAEGFLGGLLYFGPRKIC